MKGMFRSVAAITLVACLSATSGAFAQQPATQAPAAPATSAKSTAAPADKAAISKACSQQADAKGLKGKARKHFRESCKHHGGKVQ